MPQEDHRSSTFTLAEIQRLSESLAILYSEVIKAIAEEWVSKSVMSTKAAAIVVRTFVVPITHFFFDRLIRLSRISKLHDLKVIRAEFETPPPSIEAFRFDVSQSSHFNQAILAYLAPLVGLPVVDLEGSVEDNAIRMPAGFINHNNVFKMNPFRRRICRLQCKFSRWTGFFPSLYFERAKTPLSHGGFFGFGGFADMDEVMSIPAFPSSKQYREDFFSTPALKLENAMQSFVDAWAEELGERRRDIINCYWDFVRLMVPGNLLEGGGEHLKQSVRLLRRFRGRPFFLGGSSLKTRGAFFRAAGAELGSNVVSIQHGGHYGYIFDFSGVIEGEYPITDDFITWGWSEFPQHPCLINKVAVPMPSIELAAFKRNWQLGLEAVDLRASAPQYDLLFMPNKIKKFPDAPSGVSIATPDKIEATSVLMRDLAIACKSHSLRLLMKPYNLSSNSTLKATLAFMKSTLGNDFGTTEHLNKGLTPDMLLLANIILFDQPGTGFCECLCVGMPVMVIWPRTVNFETESAKQEFLALESVGIVHRTAETLGAEVLQFKRNPQAWCLNVPRRAAIEQFCSKFALTRDSWRQEWSHYLRRNRTKKESGAEK